jgi:AbrB family looped-hinge helix DNA binding protein
MQVRVDQAGRIVLPKKVRDRFSLRKDSKLELEENLEGVFLRPIEHESGLTKDEHGWLVHIGRPVGKINWERLVHEDREDRMRKIGGW